MPFNCGVSTTGTNNLKVELKQKMPHPLIAGTPTHINYLIPTYSENHAFIKRSFSVMWEWTLNV